MVQRYAENPIIVKEDIVPSQPNMKVLGVFNCGVARYKGETILLLRIAECVHNEDENLVIVPLVTEEGLETKSYNKTLDTAFDYSDSRAVLKVQENGLKRVQHLTSLSHFRIARSTDGIHFTIDPKPSIFPRCSDEEWGIEDPRITQIEDTYYITYTSVTRNGAATSLMTTMDFQQFERAGVIFAPENKDVTIFPSKINGKYYALNRPVPKIFGNPDIWIAVSDNLRYWGDQKHLFGTEKHATWEKGRVGGGAVPIPTEKGFLEIYHATNVQNEYCLGALLFSLEDPTKIIGKLTNPLMSPETDYERFGFFNNVIFTCGAIADGDCLKMYYAGTDDKICFAEISITKILSKIEPVKS